MIQELSDHYMKYFCPQQALKYSVFCVTGRNKL